MLILAEIAIIPGSCLQVKASHLNYSPTCVLQSVNFSNTTGTRKQIKWTRQLTCYTWLRVKSVRFRLQMLTNMLHTWNRSRLLTEKIWLPKWLVTNQKSSLAFNIILMPGSTFKNWQDTTFFNYKKMFAVHNMQQSESLPNRIISYHKPRKNWSRQFKGHVSMSDVIRHCSKYAHGIVG